jgi:hypothetical protein
MFYLVPCRELHGVYGFKDLLYIYAFLDPDPVPIGVTPGSGERCAASPVPQSLAFPA